MDTFLHFVKALIAYVILWFFGTNLVGGMVKGLYLANYTGQNFFRGSLIYTIILGIYLGGLYYFFNIWVMLAAVVLIVARLPDQIWEIKNSQKTIKENAPKTFLNYVFLIVMWSALPILYFAFS